MLKSEMTSCELVVEGEFASVLTMEEWGWSESTNFCLVRLFHCFVYYNIFFSFAKNKTG